MAFIYDLTDTWNAGGTTFNAIKMNVTDSASAAASRLISLQVGGAERFSVDKAGIGTFASVVRAAGGSTSAPAFSFGSDTNTGMWSPAADTLAFSGNGAELLRIVHTAAGARVGISTPNPLATLHIGTSNPEIILDETDQAVDTRIWTIRSAVSTFAIRTEVDARTGGSNAYTITRSGSSPATHQWNTGFSERMRIDSAGNVGIGTTAPGSPLDVATNSSALGIAIRGRASDNVGSLAMRSNDGATIYGQLQGRSTDLRLEAGSSNTITAFTNATERMRIDSSGNVGIGTSSPTFRLVSANSSTDGGWLYSTGAVSILGLGGYSSGASGAFSLRYDRATGDTTFNGGTRDTPTELMRIGGSGNVGIGTSSPRSRLTVGAGAAGGNPTHSGDIVVRSGMANLTSQGGLEFQSTTFSNGFGFRLSTPDFGGGSTPLVFESRSDSAAWTERMRIDSSGNLLVGTTAVDANIGGASGTGMQFSARVGFGLRSSINTDVHYWNKYPTGDLHQFRCAGAAVGSISVTGSSTAYNTSSDARLKENIAPADDAAALIDAIQVRKFDWKADGSHQRYGMIAQELLEVAPEAVNVPADEEQMMGVDYSKLVPMLVKEVQSLRARVAQLEGN